MFLASKSVASILKIVLALLITIFISLSTTSFADDSSEKTSGEKTSSEHSEHSDHSEDSDHSEESEGSEEEETSA